MLRFLIIILFVLAGAFTFLGYQRQTMKPEVIHPLPPPTPEVKVKTAPYVTSTSNPYWNSLLHDYSEYFSHAMVRNQAPGVAVAIVSDTSILFLQGYGFRDVTAQDSVDVLSVFRLGSVSKPIASYLTALLVQDSMLRWDDKVIRYLPGFALKSTESTQALTLRHLLSQSTGLPYHAYTDRVDDGANMDTLIYHLRDVNLIGKPGQFYSYQNVAYSIIGKVVKAATHETFEQVMQEKVFTPLGMNHASMNFEAMVSNENRAKPHVYSRKKGWIPVAISPTYYNAGPAGGVNASVSDMAQWMRALTSSDHSLLNDSIAHEIFSPEVKAIARNRNFRKWKKSRGSYYALGWRVLTFKDDTLNYHGGYVNGYRSEVAIKRDDKIGVCVLVNSAGPLADHALPEFFVLYEKYKEKIQQWEKHNTGNFITAKKNP